MDKYIYGTIFDNRSEYWSNNKECNIEFVKHVERHSNDLLRLKGFLPLNEIYRVLGLEETEEGKFSGWWYYTDDDSQNYITILNESETFDSKDLVLEFNVDEKTHIITLDI